MRRCLSLCEVNYAIGETLDDTFPDPFWLTAEIADCRVHNGHGYFTLTDQEDDYKAQVRATLWRARYQRLSRQFEAQAGQPFRNGLRVMIQARVRFHPYYGLSLDVQDVDPAFTVGEQARQRQETLDRLFREGLIGQNQRVPLPPTVQRLAVVSSPTAAGYQDFCHQLAHNAQGYRFAHRLFAATVQGEAAPASVGEALAAIAARASEYDAVVIVRGGGAAADLLCFDRYEVAAAVARFPLPVLTGIGHERDETLTDLTAHTRLKTPTAVATFLLERQQAAEASVRSLAQAIGRAAHETLTAQAGATRARSARLERLAGRELSLSSEQTARRTARLRTAAARELAAARTRLGLSERTLQALDPRRALRRGYTITTQAGAILRTTAAARPGATLETHFADGTVRSRIVTAEAEEALAASPAASQPQG